MTLNVGPTAVRRRTARPPHGEDVGTVVTCSRCGRQIVRIAILAPFPHKDFQHVDRDWCGGPVKPGASR